MNDCNATAKHMKRLAKLIEERRQYTGEDKTTARLEELREQKKKVKETKRKEAEELRQAVEASMQGSDRNDIVKAVRKAQAKYFSQLKKLMKSERAVKEEAKKLMFTVHSRLWRPSEQTWWDPECEHKFEDLQLLAAMNSIHLLKAPHIFEAMYPSECKQYFDFLAKKRLYDSDPEAVKPGGEAKAHKSSLDKELKERKIEGEVGKTEKELLDTVVLKESEKKKAEALLRGWNPSHKPWFNDRCAKSFSKLVEIAQSQGFDLKTKLHFKKFKQKNKADYKAHFDLMDETKKRFNEKQEAEKARKTKMVDRGTKDPVENLCWWAQPQDHRGLVSKIFLRIW